MPGQLVAEFDRLIAEQGYRTRSEAIRDLIRERLVQREWQAGEEAVVGTLTLIYDHHVSGLAQRLTEVQHDHVEEIISSLHVHLDHDNCLEVLVLRGRAAELVRVADYLLATRGVKHGKLVLTTSGKALV
ncbi:MAG: nickel-responsive transcriptional regulator NikR [Firmicutes bacterium]|nr:nickel-responsive transcriptional regulator NikR [Bacillota bacterium]